MNLSRPIWHAFSKAFTINPEEFLYDIILAGIPPTVTLLGTSLLTTAFAPIITLSPIVIPPNNFAPGAIYTLLSMIGHFPLKTPILTAE